MIDLRSDTVTQPTEDMRKAMYRAIVGDDVLEEDPTVNELEKLSAVITSKEKALFTPSGTFANQLAIATHTKRSDEIILSEDSHIIQHEVGASSVISSVNCRTIKPIKDYLQWNEIKKRIRIIKDIHYPNTGLICLENALSNGNIYPMETLREIYKNASELNIPVHLDGARIFNAAIALNIDVREITKYSDSLMFCLSKGLCSPVGSILCGKAKFIDRARKFRKLMGGGMRQVGILAASGIISLNQMRDRLYIDHRNAKKLALALSKYNIFEIDIEKIKINMVFLKLKTEDIKVSFKFIDILKKYNILTYPPENNLIRFVTHNNVSKENIDYIISKLPEIIQDLISSINK